MRNLMVLKNTVLFLVFSIPFTRCQAQETSTSDFPVPAANRTELYLPLLQNKRVALVANQTSVVFKNPQRPDKGYTHLADSLLSLGIHITKVFAPEHGFRGDIDAGEHVKNGIDQQSGLPLISLYGKNKKPGSEVLKDVDVLVFDIQDVGVRFYTYISTLHYILEAAAETKIPVIVLDRPNPNGGIIDGPTLLPEHSSFLGMHPIPLMHGMSVGEYARMILGEGWLSNDLTCDLEVIPVKSYSHGMFYSLPVRPSPNLPNDQAIKLYPGLGLFEGTNINAGRGTSYQFQRYGAPFLDPGYFTFSYTPEPNFGATKPKHNGVVCYGEDLSQSEGPRGVQLKWLLTAYKHCTDKDKFFNEASFTKHAGTAELQRQIEKGMTEEEIKATWVPGIEAFKKLREKYKIYDDQK